MTHCIPREHYTNILTGGISSWPALRITVRGVKCDQGVMVETIMRELIDNVYKSITAVSSLIIRGLINQVATVKTSQIIDSKLFI